MEEHKEPKTCIGTTGHEQYTLPFDNNPAVGKNLLEIAKKQKSEEAKKKRQEYNKAYREKKKNEEAAAKELASRQQSLFNTNESIEKFNIITSILEEMIGLLND